MRVHDGSARIEVDPSELVRLRTEPLASEVTHEVARLGFTNVTIDPQGYSGAFRDLRIVP